MTRPRTSSGPSTLRAPSICCSAGRLQQKPLEAQKSAPVRRRTARPSFSEAASPPAPGRPAAPPSSPRRAPMSWPSRKGRSWSSVKRYRAGLAAQPGGRGRHRTGRICRNIWPTWPRVRSPGAVCRAGGHAVGANRRSRHGGCHRQALHRGRVEGFWRMSNHASP